MRSSRVPASPRDVAAASSRRGWRHTRLAASAPVNPEAPATSTRASLTERPADLVQRGLDRLPALGHLGVGERTVRRPELQPQREALSPGPHLLTAVEIEDPRA